MLKQRKEFVRLVFRSIVVWSLIISFFFFLSIRVCFMSIIPAWSGELTNLIHFVLGLLVLFDQFGRGERFHDLCMLLQHSISFLDNTMRQLLLPLSFSSISSMPSLGMLLFS